MNDAIDPKTVLTMPENPRWPSSGMDVDNVWHHDVHAFTGLLQGHPNLWNGDFALKYLSVFIDTREGTRFTLRDRDGQRIHPDQVLVAVEKVARVSIVILPVAGGGVSVVKVTAHPEV